MVCCKPIPWFVTVPDLEISIIFRISSVVYNLVRIPMNLSRHVVPVLGRGGMGRGMGQGGGRARARDVGWGVGRGRGA